MKELRKKQKNEIKSLKNNHKLEKQELKDRNKESKIKENNNENIVIRYTKGEEIFNMVSHIVGGALAVLALITTLYLSIKKGDPVSIFASIIYSLSMLILYTMSSIYHGLSPKLNKAKEIFRKFDYISIFLLIAGSYTVFLLEVLRPVDSKSAWIIFGILWAATAIGAILNSINVRKFIVLSNIAFLLMGWTALFKINIIKQNMHPIGFLLLVLGGVVYTLGVIFYIIGKKIKYMHSIFHLFVLLGSILHFISIAGYVL